MIVFSPSFVIVFLGSSLKADWTESVPVLIVAMVFYLGLSIIRGLKSDGCLLDEFNLLETFSIF